MNKHTGPFKNFKFLFVILFTSFSLTISAQPAFDDDVDDEPVAGIEVPVALALGAGAVAAYCLLSKRDKKTI